MTFDTFSRAARTIVLCVVVLPAVALAADAYSEQRSQLGEANRHLRAAERFGKAERLEEAVAAYTKADKAIKEVASSLSPKLQKQYERTTRRLSEAHAALTEQGASLPALPPAPSLGQQGTLGSRSKPGSRGTTRPVGVSFVSQVAPLLAAKCGRCHIDREQGEFSLATYEQLMRGSRNAGRVLVPGDGGGSVITDLIASGDMPRGGGRVTPAELRMLLAWINEGAKFDGDNPGANLRNLKPAGASPAPQQAMAAGVPMATGSETVSFSADIAPIFLARCRNCHVNGNRGNFTMTTFKQLTEEGVVTPRNAAGSTLMRRLKGEETPQMPLNGPPLPAKELQLIEKWIQEGATFDGKALGGARAEDRLTRVAALARATRATSDELNQIRADLATRHWRTALSDVRASSLETERFLVMGAVTKNRLEAIGQQAEQAVDKIGKLFRDDEPRLGKSRVGLFVFEDRLDYSEFGSMVERRQLPSSVEGHAVHDAVDPYACVMDEPDHGGFLVSQQVAALVIAGRSGGRAPGWMTEGAARVVAAKLHPDDERPQAWGAQVARLAAGQAKPDDFMTGRIAPESAHVISYGFAKAMMRKPRDFAKLLDALAEGKGLEEAVASVYGRPPKVLAEAWVSGVGRRAGG